jgi:hypothetical protein
MIFLLARKKVKNTTRAHNACLTLMRLISSFI